MYSFRGMLERDEDYTHCCKFHKKTTMPKLLELILKTDDLLCFVCFFIITKSFPNLNKFILTGGISDSQLETLVQSFPNLIELKINCKAVSTLY